MLKKNITFIYMDSAEYSIYEPIAAEAEKRGYKVKLTNNKYEKCEIGVYCQHVNFPQYSKFSVIMLHDIIQQYGNWPDIWLREPWNKYDIGILPSDQWMENWIACSQWFYANPRQGVYKVGWPKADIIIEKYKGKYKTEFAKKYNLDLSRKTVLYAPSWENDNKQDDFVQAMMKLDVNIMVKQYNATPDVFPEQYENIRKMYEIHRNNPRVILLDTKMNIFDAIAASDILVSEESSTMCEATMMGIPAVSVSNWLIPDVTPSRYPKCDYDFVYITKKENLTEFIEEMIHHYPEYKQQTEQFRNRTFCNIGKASSIFMDIIDDCVSDIKIRYDSVSGNPRKHVSFKSYLRHIYITICREFAENYCKRYKIVSILWEFLRKVKRVFYTDHTN